MKKFFSLLAFVFLLSFTASALPPSFQGVRYGFSVAGSGVISFFKVDTRHSDKAIPRPGMSALFRMEFFPTRNVHLQFGLELMSQACAFNTYYFAPGYSQFYDRSFGYMHTLRTYELYVPLMARIGLNPDESSAKTVFYVLGGYAPKLFIGASANVVENSTGKGVWGGSTELTYENWFISPQEGNCLLAGAGFDKRLKFSEKFISIEAIFRYNLSRFIYTGRINTNELLIKNCCVSLQVGYRFPGGAKSGGVN